MTDKENVILLHGLGETTMSMQLMEWALSAAGYKVSNIGFPSTHFDGQTLTDNIIRPLIQAYGHAPRLHIVGHSMGCVLIRAVLESGLPENLGRVVMLAPGNHGSEMLQWQKQLPLMRWLLGPSLAQGGTDEECFGKHLRQDAGYELGILAGSVSLDPMSFWLPWPHDGKLSVARTHLEGAADHRVLPTTHDLITSDPRAIFQTLHFLRKGRFTGHRLLHI